MGFEPAVRITVQRLSSALTGRVEPNFPSAKQKIQVYGRRTTPAVLTKKLERFSCPLLPREVLWVIEEGRGHAASSPTRGRFAGQCLQWGTMERRLRLPRTPRGHSNRARFCFAKRSIFFEMSSFPNCSVPSAVHRLAMGRGVSPVQTSRLVSALNLFHVRSLSQHLRRSSSCWPLL